jgi:hypothetical protein
MPDANARVPDPDTRRAMPEAPRGVLRAIAAGLDALHRWWAAGRHYRPERRYMRGGRPHGTQVPTRR